MLDKITKITLGIRFSRSFRVTDITGEISDEILYRDYSPFKDIYEEVVSTNNLERILQDKSNKNTFRISPTDIIIEFPVDDFNEVFSHLVDKVLPFLEEKIFFKFQIKKIIRVGIVYYHKVDQYHLIEDITNLVTNNGVAEPNNFKLSFSKKNSSGKSVMKKNDYLNSIYTIEQKEDIYSISLDYQKLFGPIVEDFRDCKLHDFLHSSRTYLTENFYKWVLPHVES